MNVTLQLHPISEPADDQITVLFFAQVWDEEGYEQGSPGYFENGVLIKNIDYPGVDIPFTVLVEDGVCSMPTHWAHFPTWEDVQ